MKFETPTGPVDIAIRDVVVAGWTGRDAAAVAHHIEELAAIGVAPPSQVPLFYRVSNGLLTQAAEIQVLGQETSGEIEPLVIRAGGETWLGLASDHTDRALEAHSVAASKQICPKPVSSTLWRWSEVADHLDDLTLTCEIEEDGRMVVYQSGTLSGIRPLGDLVAGAGLGDGGAMLCGTLPAIGGVRPASRYRMSLADPATGREIAFDYSVAELPVVA